MGLEPSSSRASVIVVMDANRKCGNLAPLNWALDKVIRPKDTVIVLGILCECSKRNSCFPFYMGISFSAIWERLEFSAPGEMTPKVLEEEIIKKREEYQVALQPFYRQCKKNEVKLEVKLAAGFSPKMITVEEAQKTNTHWIVLDSHLKNDRTFIYEHVGCNVAVMKSNNVATIMLSVAVGSENQDRMLPMNIDQEVLSIQPEYSQCELIDASHEDKSPSSPPSTCWCPFSWRLGFPRNFTIGEIESMTDGFADENLLFEDECVQVYKGILMESPLIVKCFMNSDKSFGSELEILSRVRHRNILNLVGYCCTGVSMYLLKDFPCNGFLDKHLECDELAKKLSWKVRWDIALGVASCLRYLQEECLDGPVVRLDVSSSRIALSHNFSPLVADFCSAKWLDDDSESDTTSSFERLSKYATTPEDERLSLDVYAFGVLLLELITGQKALSIDGGQMLVDQVSHFIDTGSLSQVIDQRLTHSCDSKEVHFMSSAALLCVKNDFVHRPTASEVVAVLRGDRFATSHW